MKGYLGWAGQCEHLTPGCSLCLESNKQMGEIISKIVIIFWINNFWKWEVSGKQVVQMGWKIPQAIVRIEMTGELVGGA